MLPTAHEPPRDGPGQADLYPVAGVDEAGRGPVLGPLVVAGVRVARDDDLVELGVRDSKALSPKRREALAVAVREVADAVAVRVVEPPELDRRMAEASLNRVEAEVFAEVVSELAPARAVVDACDTNPERFGGVVRAHASHPCEVVSEHGADARYPCVSAASIVAKVTRDAAVRRIAEELGREVGSGYASDKRTRAFLEAWVAEHGDLPPHTRRRWETAKRLLPRDRSLLEF